MRIRGTTARGEKFGRVLQALMLEQGMTQKDLAERTGLSEASVSRYIFGTRSPGAVSLAKIAKALGTDSEHILEKVLQSEDTADTSEPVGQETDSAEADRNSDIRTEMSENGFGQRLRKLLQERDVTQRELARIVGTGTSVISHYVNGLHRPTLINLIAIAKALDTTTEYLVGGKSDCGDGSTDEIEYAVQVIRCNAHRISPDRKLEIIRMLL